MSDLKTILKQIKVLPKYSKVALNKIDRELISKMFIRFRTLEILTEELRKTVVDNVLVKMPSQTDLLSLKPISVYEEEYSIEKVVGTSFALAAKERDDFVDSLIDILKMYRCSSPVDFGSIDKSTLEFLSRLPSIGEAREFRRCILKRGCTVYFMSNRIMVLVSTGDGNPTEDQNYFITAIDLGTLFQYIIRDGDLIPPVLVNTTIGRFKPAYFTGRPRFVNTQLVLWEEVNDPARYYWFVSGVNTKRPNYTYEIEFKQRSGRKVFALNKEQWANIKRVFGIPALDNVKISDFTVYENVA